MRKSKAVSREETKTKLEERKSVRGGEGKFGMEAKGANSFYLLPANLGTLKTSFVVLPTL